MNNSERARSRENPFAGLEEAYNHTHEIHRYRLRGGEIVAAVSARTWPEYIGYLSRVSDEDKFVISPELMTFPDRPLSEIAGARQLIEARVEEVREISKKHPRATFLLGTPTFPETGKPRNSVVFIRNGEVVGSTNKRSGAIPEERRYFDLPAEEPAALVPGTSTGVLICADLATAAMYLRSASPPERVLRLAGRSNLIGTCPTFLHPQAESLVVLSCWGIGARPGFVKPGAADEYYRSQLRSIAAQVLRESSVQEIVMADRVPIVEEKLKPITPTKPFNALLRAGM